MNTTQLNFSDEYNFSDNFKASVCAYLDPRRLYDARFLKSLRDTVQRELKAMVRKQQLIRRWRGVARAIGQLLALQRRAAERVYAPSGAGYQEAAASFAAAAASTAATSTLATLIGDSPIVLAPMVRGSELAFRMLVRRHGVRLCYSPMLKAELIVAGDADELALLHESALPEDRPLIIQLGGRDPATLAEATRIVLRAVPDVSAVDLNLGCPQACAEKGQYGAFLIEREPQLACDCVRAMVAAAGGTPITAKLRIQPDAAATVECGRLLVGAGCSLLSVHARRRPSHCVLRDHTKTKRAREERPSDDDFAIVAALAAALPEVPVLVNGGVCSVDDARELVARTGAAAAMVGSALLCNPRLGAGGEAARPADLADEYLDMCERHSVPSPLFIRRHLRWIFRAELEPDGPADLAARDSWRARLWTFLVRPYLETLWQFREVVRLFRHLEAGGAATDGAPSFKSVRSGEAVDDDNEAAEWQLSFE